MAEIERGHSKIYGAWFYDSSGMPLDKDKGLPVEGWKLLEVIHGKWNGIEELRSKIDAVLELHPRCDVLLIGRGDYFDIYDIKAYKQKYWPKPPWKNLEEHVR